MELIDILDGDGNATGKIVSRGQPLEKDEYRLGAHIYIVNSSGNLLLQKRAETKTTYPGIWDLHMGHAVSGETTKECAIREVFEEINIKLCEDELEFIQRFKWESYKLFIDIWLVRKDICISSVVLPKGEVIELKYISKNELLRMLEDTSCKRTWRPNEYIEIIDRIL